MDGHNGAGKIGAGATGRTSGPDVEVLARAKRRTFSAKYKRRIVDDAARAKVRGGEGAIGELLRREGLYSSHLTTWRREAEAGLLGRKKRGPKPKVVDERDRRVAQLERENANLKARAERAELLVEIQKKVSALLGLPLTPNDGER